MQIFNSIRLLEAEQRNALFITVFSEIVTNAEILSDSLTIWLDFSAFFLLQN